MAERNVVVRLSAETSGAIASMTRFGAATRKAMGEAEVATGRHNKVLGALASTAKYTGIAVAGGLALAVKQAADFNEKMALVQTLSHANAHQMRDLSQAALHAGTAYGYTASQVADGQAEMVKAGVSLKDIMGGGLKGALTLAAAGQTDVANATEIAAAAMTQFRLKGKDIPHIADLLAAGADKALGSVTDLGYGLSQVGTTAHQSGLSIEQTTGTLAAFAQAGLIGEKGGTTFKQMLLKLEKPSKAAQEVMDQYGFSLYKANGQIKTMPELAANLQHSFEHLTPAARNFALGQIFGTRAIQGANIMMAEGAKGIANWIRRVNDQGFAAHQASGKLNSLKGDLQKLKAEGVNALIELGQGSQSPLRHLVQDITGGIRKITTDGSLKRWGNEVGQTLQTVIDGAKPVASAIGDIVSAFNSLPSPLKAGLATAGITAFVARKVPGVGAAAGAATSLGRGGVVPVFVTNAGFGKPGKGTGGGLIAGGEQGAAKGSRLGRFAATAGGAVNIPNIIASVLTVQGIKSAGSANDAIGAGATGGAFLGARVGGPIGALTGAGIGAVVGAESFKDPTEKAYEKHNKTVKDLVHTYQLLQKKQHELHSSDSSWIPPAALINGDKMKNVLTAIEHQTGLTGKALRSFASGGVDPAQKKIQGASANLDAMVQSAHHAGVSTQQLGQMMKSLPSQVVTKLLTPGAVKSTKDVRALGRQYGLTPRQVQTLLKLLGFKDAEGKIDHHKKSLKDLNGQTAKPRVTPADADFEPKIKRDKNALHTLGVQQAKPKVSVNDQASGPLNRIGGAVAGLNGRHATVTITTNHVTHYSTTGSTKGKPLPDAPGTAHGAIRRNYAAGDVANGHEPIIERQPKYRMWAEPETKGESYIPLADDWRRPRAVAIWRETGHLLGQYAAGGVSRFAGGGIDDLHYRHSIQGVTRELRKLTEAIKNTRTARKEYSKTVAQAYVTDPFGGTLGGFDSQVAYETKRIKGARTDLATLRAHGLNGALYKDLAASGNATLIDQFSHLTRAQITARERAYRGRSSQDAALGNQAATGVYATRIKDLAHETKELRRELHRLRTGHHIGNTNINRQVNHNAGAKKRKQGARQLRNS